MSPQLANKVIFLAENLITNIKEEIQFFSFLSTQYFSHDKLWLLLNNARCLDERKYLIIMYLRMSVLGVGRVGCEKYLSGTETELESGEQVEHKRVSETRLKKENNRIKPEW